MRQLLFLSLLILFGAFLFFLMSLAKDSSIFISFQITSFWFYFFVLDFILFISNLIFIISFLSLTLGFVCSLFSIGSANPTYLCGYQGEIP